MEETKETKSTIKTITKDNLRLLLNSANSLGITKDHIIQIIKDSGQFILIYQK